MFAYAGFCAALLLLLIVIAVKLLLGSVGKPYPDLSTKPVLAEIESIIDLDEPPGNVAVSTDGRIFFNFHSEARPEKVKVAELIGKQVLPFPSDEAQKVLFDTVFSVRIDRQGRLWTLDHGFNGLRQPRLLAFDIATGAEVHRYDFPKTIAGLGSFLNDLQIDTGGNKIYIADTSVFARRPALIVYDVQAKHAQRFLENHRSVQAEELLIKTPQKEMVFLGGLIPLKPAVDSIVLDKNNEWLYYGAMAGSTLFRVPAKALNESLSSAQIEAAVESYSKKPQSDGLSIDLEGTIYITAIEHSGIMTLDKNKNLVTLVKNGNIRWPDGLSFGPNGWLYLTDSALTDAMLMSKRHIESARPYHIYRVKINAASTPGH